MSRPRILIVEDEQITQMHLAMCLEALGYDVVDTADTAADAVAAAAKYLPDLVLMDISLRGDGDGVAAAAAIRAARPVPVVFLTAYTDPATVERAKAVGPAGYLTKPFDEGEVKAAVEAALGRE